MRGKGWASPVLVIDKQLGPGVRLSELPHQETIKIIKRRACSKLCKLLRSAGS